MENKLPHEDDGFAKYAAALHSITPADLASLPLTKKGDKKSPNHKGVPETIECVECAKALKNL
ncbi:MAG: hypothetical protein A2545_07710 [Planctomycetes bacterium RIFOXYD2_FULL_41_16]|nr:MAG: hypothetical protein A2545_07710 [Planctomycetes bacterium RIFOXYD2_FULL_41_16]